MKPRALYEERSGWSWWVHPLIGLTFLAAVFPLVELARGNVGGWEGAEAITYSPLGEFGGWGIRIGGNMKKAWTVRGNRAVLLRLKDGTLFYLGSDRPERVLQWVLSATKRSEE